jgi:hypothetical protein
MRCADRATTMITLLLVAVLLTLTACSGSDDAASRSPGPSPTPSLSSGPQQLQDGPVPPGRHRFRVTSTCDRRMGCPVDAEPALPALEVTVPDGWDAATEFLSLFTTDGRDNVSRDGVALVMGWTNFWLGLNSNPCARVSHQTPDIPVGPTVEDFVDAVAAHPLLDVTRPKPVRMGRYGGTFFSLTGPKDISDCVEWRPWDPGPYVQGTENQWDLWVIDVAGVRVVIMAEYFPETPKDVKADLRAMAESIRFRPARRS